MLGKSVQAAGMALLLSWGSSMGIASAQTVTDEPRNGMEEQDIERDELENARERPERQRDRMTDDIDRDAEWPDDAEEVLIPEPEENGNGLFAPPGREDDPALLK